jgi:hypothetical protein
MLLMSKIENQNAPNTTTKTEVSRAENLGKAGVKK